jgi:hypothetical protein
MRNKKTLRMITALIASVMICGMMGATMTAYAYTDEDAEREVDLDEILTSAVTPDPTPEPTPTPTPEPQPLTPDGNLTLVDDISGEQANDKQIITVITKSGAYFYIVIDRAGDKENVYFLNLVDEYDLLAIMEGEKTVTPPASATPTPTDETPEQSPAPDEPAPEPKSNNTTGLLIMLLIIAAAGGGAFYYFKVLKPKQGVKKGASVTELDEFDFDADEDDFDGSITDGQDGEDNDGGEEIPDFTELEPPAPDSPLDGYGDDFTFGIDESEGKK